MKNIYVFLFTVFLFIGFFNCKNPEKDSKEKSIELMTAQTLGLAYLEEFKLDEAENEFLKVISLAPHQKLGYANLGLAYLRKGNYKKAEKQLFKAIEIDSMDADIRLLLATVYQMDDKRDKEFLGTFEAQYPVAEDIGEKKVVDEEPGRNLT